MKGIEGKIEQYLVKRVKVSGGMCLKLSGYKGIPDRIVLMNGKVYFVEVKKTGGGVVSEAQVEMLKKLNDAGYIAVILDSKESVDKFLRRNA